MAKYKGKKIKRRKNLYKPRKSHIRKVFEMLAMLVIVAGLGFVGFSAGRPLVEFFFGDSDGNGDAEDSVPDNAPPDDHNDTNGGDDETTEVIAPDDSVPDTPADSNYTAVYAPGSVLDNSTALSAYISQAKSNGYNAVVLEMKDTTGSLLYNSSVQAVQNTEIIKGTLTAEQIYTAFEGTDVTPIARVNTLLDQLSPVNIDDVSYFMRGGNTRWADNRLDAGGKFWANPFLSGTREYMAQIVSELASAGFTEIVLANTVFPFFRGVDFDYLDSRFTNISTRYEGLVSFIAACADKKGSAELRIEMSLGDVITNYDGYNNTSEILRGIKDLKDVSLLLVYNRADFGEELKTGANSSVRLPSDIAGLIDTLYKQAERNTGELGIMPCLAVQGLTDTEAKDVLRAFIELGYDSYAVR